MKEISAKLKKGFTLVEIMMALTVFAIAMTSASSVFFLVQDSWRRQKNSLDILRNGQWAMEFIANDLRSADKSLHTDKTEKGKSKAPSKNLLRFNPPGATRVYYWLGDSSKNHGEDNVLYRGQAGNFNDVIDNRRELARFIAVNYTTGDNYEIFTQDGNEDPVIITLVLRPRPQDPPGRGNQNFVLRTKVMPRGQ